jgi:tight adherence protein C
MESLLQALRIHLGDSALASAAFVALTALTVFAFSLGLSALGLGLVDPMRRRLKRLAGVERDDTSRAESIAALLQPLSAYILPKKDWDRSQVGRQLVQAGYRSAHAVTFYYAARALALLVLPASVLIASRWLPEVPSMKILFYAAVAAFLGSIIPGAVLDRLVARRKRALRVAFPDALDLLVVCVESGLGLAPALQRVADELAVSHPELGAELMLVNAEVRAGVERAQALKNLADRTGLEDIRGLVALLVQTMRFGTSVADALRVYSEEFRDKRMQAAEEQAAKIGTKMIFPLVLCMFPAFFLVAIGPAVLRLIDVFGQMAR